MGGEHEERQPGRQYGPHRLRSAKGAPLTVLLTGNQVLQLIGTASPRINRCSSLQRRDDLAEHGEEHV